MKAPSVQLLRALRRASTLQPQSRTQYIITQARPLAQGSFHQRNAFSTTGAAHAAPPMSRDRGPESKEDTQTDFGSMDVLGNTPPPSTCIDACLSDGFHLENGTKIGNGSGCLLISGEAFEWRPWESSDGMRNSMVNAKGQWEVPEESWGALDLVWPKPELLILGLGGGLYPIAPATRRHINALGIRVDIQDTRNASAQFNLLATERGVGNVAAALLPIGWKI